MEQNRRLIDANALIDWLTSQTGFITNCEDCCEIDCLNCIIDEAIKNFSTVEAEPVRHGRWIFKWDAEKDPKRLFVRVVCSRCNLHTGQKSNYCPNCGAKMDLEE